MICEQSWAGKQDKDGEPLATGYSCRSQVKSIADRKLRHPLKVVLRYVIRRTPAVRPSNTTHLPAPHSPLFHIDLKLPQPHPVSF